MPIGSERSSLELTEIKVVDKKERLYEFVASSDAIDRVGDIILQNWDLKSFKSNPVFLYGHDYHSLPVGRVVKIWTEKVEGKTTLGKPAKRTKIQVKFADPEMYPFAGIVSAMYENKLLNAVSVGFRAKSRRVPTEEEREKFGIPAYGLIFEKAELLEVSAVTVPANPEALHTPVSRGIITEEESKSLIEDPTSFLRRNIDPDVAKQLEEEMYTPLEDEDQTSLEIAEDSYKTFSVKLRDRDGGIRRWSEFKVKEGRIEVETVPNGEALCLKFNSSDGWNSETSKAWVEKNKKELLRTKFITPIGTALEIETDTSNEKLASSLDALAKAIQGMNKDEECFTEVTFGEEDDTPLDKGDEEFKSLLRSLEAEFSKGA